MSTESPSSTGRDRLLSPVTVGADATTGDAAVVDAMVSVEVALVRAWAAVGVAPAGVAAAAGAAFGWDDATGRCTGHGIDAARLAASAPTTGSPVMALVREMRAAAPAEVAPWIHRGATSQDILDSALMIVTADGARAVREDLGRAVAGLTRLAEAVGDAPAVARTLTQHAVPTTWALRISRWRSGLERAARRVENVVAQAPAQLGGAASTLAGPLEVARAEGPDEAGAHAAAAALPRALAGALGLRAPDAPWHTTRWPITEAGDALVQATDALAAMASDLATLARPEIAEVRLAAGGGSTAMPHKRNPVGAVLLRSAAIRAPHLAASLHTSAAMAVDERSDGAWHAEWPVLQDLVGLAVGAAATAVPLVEGVSVDADRSAATLADALPGVLSERLRISLEPRLGPERASEAIALATVQELRAWLGAQPERADVDIDDLLDPARATGLAVRLAQDEVRE